MTEYQPGDRVRLIEEYGGRPIGWEFVVEDTESSMAGDHLLRGHGRTDGEYIGVFASRVERAPGSEPQPEIDPWIRSAGNTVLYDLPALVRHLGIDMAESSTRHDMEHLRDTLIESIGTAVTDGQTSPLAGECFDSNHDSTGSVDQRIDAYSRLADHPFFRPAFERDGRLIDGMIDLLDGQMVQSVDAQPEDGETNMPPGETFTFEGWSPANLRPLAAEEIVPEEEGWHTAPDVEKNIVSDYLRETAVDLGLEIRVQTKPKR